MLFNTIKVYEEAGCFHPVNLLVKAEDGGITWVLREHGCGPEDYIDIGYADSQTKAIAAADKITGFTKEVL